MEYKIFYQLHPQPPQPPPQLNPPPHPENQLEPDELGGVV